MDTVSLTIDGKTVTAEKGRTVLQAAIEAGIRVPYYCYHPGLGIDGSCRVCIVKIEKMPKLQTSCSTPVADGMVVHTQTPDVVDARASVFEFLLINHPLDCPVCDKGGECPLQDFSYSFGPNESRMGFPRRVFDGEGVKADVDFGPTLMLNRNRCILCTRCVRFMKEVDTDAQINIVDRGYGSEIATFQEEGVHSLLSGNLMDVCPVGAITTRDYRFKAPPVGQPRGGGHHLHALREGLQHDGVAQGQARVGEGRAAGAHDAAVQSGGQWLLDVRHRPLRLSLDRGRRPPRPAARSRRRAGTSWSQALRAAVGACRRRRRTFGAAVPRSPRTRRSKSSPSSDGSAARSTCRRERRDQLAHERQVAAGEHKVQGAAGRCAERARRARSRLPRQRHFVRRRRPHRVPRRRRGWPGASLYVFDPGPDGSIGDVSWVIAARNPAVCHCSSCRACC